MTIITEDNGVCMNTSHERLGWTVRRIEAVDNGFVRLNDGVSFNCSHLFPGAEPGDIWAVHHEPAPPFAFGGIGKAVLLERPGSTLATQQNLPAQSQVPSGSEVEADECYPRGCKWLFWISQDTPEEDPDVCIVSKPYWDKYECLDDQHIERRLGKLLPEGFSESYESVFELVDIDVQTARERLIKAGFEEIPDPFV